MKRTAKCFAISLLAIGAVSANPNAYGMNQQAYTSYMVGQQGMMNQGMVDPSLADPQMNLNQPYVNQQMMIQPDAPGITNPLSINALIHTANARVDPQQMQDLTMAVQAYVDGNLSDARELFSAVTNKYPEGVATDRAYLGLAKVERAYGAYDVSRRILEAVIRKNRDYESIQLARRAYQDLEQEVNRSTGEAAQMMEMAYARYEEIGWLNVFSKIRAYNEYKDAKANYEALMISSRQFDQIFVQQNITTPVPEANLPDNDNLDSSVPSDVESQIDNILDPGNTVATPAVIQPVVTAGSVTQNTGMFPVGDTSVRSIATPAVTVQPTVVNSTAIPAVETVATPAETPVTERIKNMNMDEARQEYMKAYDDLREALKNNDPQARQEAQTRYQAALEQYNLLRAQQ